MNLNEPKREWITAAQAWRRFAAEHPELGYRDDKWQLYNFLRVHKNTLIENDAIRWARGRYWIAEYGRFSRACFEAVAGPMQQPGSKLPDEQGRPEEVLGTLLSVAIVSSTAALSMCGDSPRNCVASLDGPLQQLRDAVDRLIQNRRVQAAPAPRPGSDASSDMSVLQ